MYKPLQRLLGMAFVLVAVTAFTACGSSSSNSSSGNGKGNAGTQIGSQTGSKAAVAKAAGEKAAAAAGPAVKVPSITVGYVEGTSGSEVSRRVTAAARQAAAVMGWKFMYCEGQGVPAKIAECAQSLIDANVNVILSIANDPSMINRQLQEAKAKKIPFFNIGGAIPNAPGVTAQYVPDDALMTHTIDNYLFQQMKQKGVSTIAIQTSTANGALRARPVALQQDVAANPLNIPGLKIIASNETDFANPGPSVTASVRTVLTANPSLGAYWASLDFDIPPLVAAVRSSAPAGKRPIIVGFFADKVSMDLIRRGDVSALVEVANEATAWTAIDQAAELVARKKAPVQDEYMRTIYPLQFVKPFIVDKTDLPPQGQLASPPADFVTFFETKWAKEFGK
jgi:ABC-type sugar transport system substrate-binding protein